MYNMLANSEMRCTFNFTLDINFPLHITNVNAARMQQQYQEQLQIEQKNQYKGIHREGSKGHQPSKTDQQGYQGQLTPQRYSNKSEKYKVYEGTSSMGKLLGTW